MPSCDIEDCSEVADKIFDTDKEFEYVALCVRHNPESPRGIRRRKTPSDPDHTKKRNRRPSKSREQVLRVEEVQKLHSQRRRMAL